MDSSSSEDDFVALSLIEKRRKRKYCVHPILKLRREEAPPYKGVANLSRAIQNLPQNVSGTV